MRYRLEVRWMLINPRKDARLHAVAEFQFGSNIYQSLGIPPVFIAECGIHSRQWKRDDYRHGKCKNCMRTLAITRIKARHKLEFYNYT
jgi:hypothetical protein